MTSENTQQAPNHSQANILLKHPQKTYFFHLYIQNSIIQSQNTCSPIPLAVDIKKYGRFALWNTIKNLNIQGNNDFTLKKGLNYFGSS